MRILLVHGRAQEGRHADELKATWIETLKQGFHNARASWPETMAIDFPYYADLLDRFAATANLPTPEDVAAKGPGQDRQFEAFMQSALDEMKTNAAIPDAEVATYMQPARAQDKGVQNWNWVQAIARAIDNRLTSTSTFVIEKFLRDVYLYISNREVARQINAIVEEKLSDEPTLVIGHSLGSVVAYKVILESRARMNLKKYITVGSPLGLRAISSKLGVPENPGGNGGWYNAYDDRDIVALNPLDDTYFPAEPAIVNYKGVKNYTDNRHGIIGYLNDKTIAQQIASALA